MVLEAGKTVNGRDTAEGHPGVLVYLLIWVLIS